ncbi:NAD(P)H-dependent oxidoreductase [Paenibacillus mucilaginosus]|uniref:NADH dehydrogenase n=2 Tax=Paenibacillus mucilaginosus TaxID=61624 RepID=H6NHA5_9BACL|nr:NAD(P)H-dependent oxidoreductase [Paenibacillus mucilaginosus]AEI40485.1 NAD(P)H dehydrogenase (quinone) [Paenibacillus mucilaginosus KNP414]AFC29100.1 NADH dehydrogenase [Paenibacillus mucilaginosus 3016]MCG7213171.1 NAD(P)H-dependent oxidoreductase [Paenibacillus mucilaginosus]WDM29659.1 NAD(P)H-dependent oxidoreductase [Paenibacillus mucilaginosus]WFA17842.1 general stress protein [Paenibacillus mucilaginosus]
MKTLIIVAHPDLQNSRINRALTDTMREQPDTTVHDLYELYRDSSINVPQEQALLDSHDRIIFQYPLYWYSTPPLLKQWFDEVLAYGWAFGPGGEHLLGKEIGIAISTAGTSASYQPGGYNLFTIRDIAKPVEALANYVSAHYLSPFAIHNAQHITDEQLAESQAAYVQHLERVRHVKTADLITMNK